jgi:hypothetical protein
MYSFVARCRKAVLVAVLAVGAAACGRDGTGPGAGLTPEQVGGIYHICQLVFTPNNPDLYAAVDVRARAMNTAPDAETPARLYVDQLQTQFALQYLRGTFLERHEGTYRIVGQNVELTFANPAVVAARLLVPALLSTGFQAAPNRLEFSMPGHDVSGQDYALLRGISPVDAPATIRGTIAGRFQVGGCD